MAIHYLCPQCQTALRLPDGCGGQSTTCPSCLADFLIPPPVVGVAVTPVGTVAARGAVEITEADVQRAELETQQLAADDLACQIRLDERRRQKQRESRRLSTLKLFHSGRHALDRTVGRIGGFFLALTVGAALLVLMASHFSPSAFGYFIVTALGLVLSGVAYLPFSFVPDDETLLPMIDQASAMLSATTAHFERLSAEAVDSRRKYLECQAEHRRLKAAFESTLRWLRDCPWRQMTGTIFESFLIKVFEEHGYRVEPTGGSGDQGVDLIVERHGTRVAVQAKGHVEKSVGNDAVQQVHAGMSFYRCNAAAVVTNSRFTASARALADRIGCRLLDGSEIPDLIDGRIIL